ncbi:YihY/virulence factor BrkB family protein [uncultured Pontibacter sp.]|uniref:YihY/virulence factor BrkB family protein n=1 Tax=uncultured Pontibacter sp. TaxID=453356 RepID=UPI002629FC85|nr:YihY/virulence factor BrkB family protein [uncultured Pontibacter sp.]
MNTFLKSSWQILKDSKNNFQQGEPIVYSAAIAFFTIFSLPAILIFLSFIGSFFFSEDEVQGEIVQHIKELISKDAARQVNEVLANITDIPVSFWGIVVGLAVIIKSATIIFFIVQKALNSVWQVKVKNDVKYLTLLKHRILTLLIVASLGFFFISSILLDMILSIFSEQLHDLFEEYLSPAIRTINTAFNILMMLVFFTAIHKVLPDAKISWKNALAGGIITSVLFLIGKEVINLILENVKVAGIYATAGSLVVLLLWVFYSAVILMLGAEVTKAYASHHNRDVAPTEIAVKYKRVNEHEVHS